MPRAGVLVRAMVGLRTQERTGRLKVTISDRQTFVYLKAGEPIFAEEGSAGETLGRLLLRQQRITHEQYLEVLSKMTDALFFNEQIRFGETAVELGFLTEEQVEHALRDQVRWKIVRCFQAQDVTWEFEDNASLVEDVGDFRMVLEGLVFDAMLWLDSDRRLGLGLADAMDKYIYLPPMARAELVEELADEAGLERFLLLLDGQMTTRDVLAATASASLDTEAMLTTIIVLGACRITPEAYAGSVRDPRFIPAPMPSEPRSPTNGAPKTATAERKVIPRDEPDEAREDANRLDRPTPRVPLVEAPRGPAERPVEREHISLAAMVPPKEAPRPARAIEAPRPQPIAAAPAQPGAPARPVPAPPPSSPTTIPQAVPAPKLDATKPAAPRPAAPPNIAPARAAPIAAAPIPPPPASSQGQRPVPKRRPSRTMTPVVARTPAGIGFIEQTIDRKKTSEIVTRLKQAPAPDPELTRTPTSPHEQRLLAEQAFQRGRAHLEAERNAQAAAAFKRAGELAPDNEEFALLALWCEGRARVWADEAVAEQLKRRAHRAIQRDQNMAFGYHVLGYLGFVAQDLERAKKFFTRAIKLDPSLKDAQRHLRLTNARIEAQTKKK